MVDIQKEIKETMITIIILLVMISIYLMTNAQGITIGVSTTNDRGTVFDDSITMNGDVIADGKYIIDRSNVFENMNAKVGSGRLVEDTKLQASIGVTPPHHLSSSMSKLIENSGDGTGYMGTGVSVDGILFDVVSYMQTDSKVDHGEMHNSIGNKISMQDNADISWHNENVQAESCLEFDGYHLIETLIKVKASG